MATRKRKSLSTIDSIDVAKTLKEAQACLEQDPSVSTTTKATLTMLIMLVKLLLDRLGLNSTNSSKPPSSDPDRLKQPAQKTSRKPGGQPGHEGRTLTPVDDPDEVIHLSIDKRTLPKGDYWLVEPEKRQVVDILIQRVVTEYRAEVLVNAHGQHFVAAFPSEVTQHVQYGSGIKAHAVYLSQYQVLPFERIQTYFQDQAGIPIGVASLVAFNQQAAEKLTALEISASIQKAIQQSLVVNADESPANVGGQRHWFHVASTPSWTHYHVDPSRGYEAMLNANVLPHVTDVLCHDHWKPYYRWTSAQHALCNAHHLRELERAGEQDQQPWAQVLKQWLLDLNNIVNDAGGVLSERKQLEVRAHYRELLAKGNEQCPATQDNRPPGKRRGKVKQSKSRNLLQRLTDYEDDVLRFMTRVDVPFTNNLGERDIRMLKLQQKISGCFRSLAGAQAFCQNRGFISTCIKQGISPAKALSNLFNNIAPDFIESG